MAPQVRQTPRSPDHRKVGTLPVDTMKDTAQPAHPSTPEEHPYACYDGVVFVGEMVVADDGDETESITSVPCRRCASEAKR